MDRRMYYYLIMLTARNFKSAHPNCRAKITVRDYYVAAKEQIKEDWGIEIEPMGRKEYSEFAREVAFAVRRGGFQLRRRIFIDMDGTLAVWKPCKQIEDLYQPGYFAELAPQMTVVEATRMLVKNYRKDVEIFILSAVLEDNASAIPDKNRWLDRYLPEIDTGHRIFASGNVPKYMAVPYGIRADDTLLDDYTTNLLVWDQYAKGIKLLNGMNHSKKTWQGIKVHRYEGADAIVKTILSAMK